MTATTHTRPTIGVIGLWHLGSVTAACCASHGAVVGFDPDAEIVKKLGEGRAPIAEPGLDDLLARNLADGRLRFTADRADFAAATDLLWVTFDTPVDADDVANVDFVLDEVRRTIPFLRVGTLVLLSSQLPVGTCARLETEFGEANYRFACSPENLRLGRAIEIFTNPDRIVAGYRDATARDELADLFAPFTDRVEWMRSESAEMAKHAINAFLAVSVTFMNEVSLLCEATGADATEVERALKSEQRIGPSAYLSPGAAFAGGTLARDVVTGIELGRRHGETLSIFPAIKESNDRHRDWPVRKLLQRLPDLSGARVALIGLTYKPGTDTLRRSSAVEWAQQLHAAGAHIIAFDPAVRTLPPELDFISLADDLPATVADADALIACTGWPEFRERDDWLDLIAIMRRPLVLDPAKILARALGGNADVDYLTVGSPR